MKLLITIALILILMANGFGKELIKEKTGNKIIDTIKFNNFLIKPFTEDLSVPKYFKVEQNYPNPFNATTVIEYDLPKGAMTTIKIYNSLGEMTKLLENNSKEAGTHRLEWDGTNNFGESVTSGPYYYIVVADNYYSIKKMELLK